MKIGDYVTPQTRLTSVDQDNLVEAYIYVPINKAATIQAETRVALLGEDGKAICERNRRSSRRRSTWTRKRCW